MDAIQPCGKPQGFLAKKGKIALVTGWMLMTPADREMILEIFGYPDRFLEVLGMRTIWRGMPRFTDQIGLQDMEGLFNSDRKPAWINKKLDPGLKTIQIPPRVSFYLFYRNIRIYSFAFPEDRNKQIFEIMLCRQGLPAFYVEGINHDTTIA